jgi:hypothetical protein
MVPLGLVADDIASGHRRSAQDPVGQQMSAYQGIGLAANGTSPPLDVNPVANIYGQAAPAYAFGLICTLSVGASLTYTVQVTADPFPSPNGNWNNHDILANQTASANSNVAYPITGIRLVVTNWVSGSVNLGVAKWP